MAETVAAALAEAGASPQEIASAIKAALSGKTIDRQLTESLVESLEFNLTSIIIARFQIWLN